MGNHTSHSQENHIIKYNVSTEKVEIFFQSKNENAQTQTKQQSLNLNKLIDIIIKDTLQARYLPLRKEIIKQYIEIQAYTNMQSELNTLNIKYDAEYIELKKAVKSKINNADFNMENIITAWKGLPDLIIHAYRYNLSPVITPDAIWNHLFAYLMFIKNTHPSSISEAAEGNLRGRDLYNHFDTFKRKIMMQKFHMIDKSSGNGKTQYIKLDVCKERFINDFTTTRETDIKLYTMIAADETKITYTPSSKVICGCNRIIDEDEKIPSIIIEGTQTDWMRLKEKYCSLLNLLNEYNETSSNVMDILNEFINVYNGDINKKFWSSIYYKYDELNLCKGGEFTGWIKYLINNYTHEYTEIPDLIYYINYHDSNYIFSFPSLEIKDNTIRMGQNLIDINISII